MGGQSEQQRAVDALKNATTLTILFVTGKLASDEQCKEIGASLRAAADYVEDAAIDGSDWPCDVSLMREIADMLEGAVAAPSWAPEVIIGGRSAKD